MTTTLLERTRAAHEDIELFERAIVEALIEDARTHRDNVNHAHWVNTFSSKIQDRSKFLLDTYEDRDGSRRAEINAIGGKGAQLYQAYYEQLRLLKEYHRRFPNLAPERPEAESMLNTLDVDDMVRFSGEEGYGKYLDLNEHYVAYLNLPGLANAESITYFEYLDIFFKFTDRTLKKETPYLKYLENLDAYLRDFLVRAQPLLDLKAKLATIQDEFNTAWENGTFTAIGETDEERERAKDPLWDKYSQKLFTNPNVFESYKKGKNYQKNINKYNTESTIHQLVDLLEETVEATKRNVERKLARTSMDAAEEEEDQMSEIESSSEDEGEVVRMTKQNYPLDHTGNPIPFWLYRLHGLGIEYKCEICGNTSYWGRRAFEKHFTEWRHSHGLRCLRIENSKEFYEVTKISDALELAKKLRDTEQTDQEMMEEYEDSDGHVMDRRTYMDLAAQGLL